MDYLKDTIPQRRKQPSGKQIELEIEGVTLVADLLDDKAPRTCAMILDVLPLEEPISHQQWSGSGLQVHGSRLREATRKAGLWPDPMYPDYSENPNIYGCRGELSFHPISPGLFITYGKSVFSGPEYGVLPSYLFAEINQDLDKLRSIGRKIAREGRTEIIIREKK
jgi:hypothetical protein